MKIVEKRGLSEKLKECFLGDDGVVALYLFGSFATGMSTVLSDMDLAVLLREPFNRKKVLNISARASFALKKENIDILVLNTAPVYLSFRVLKEGNLLLCHDEKSLADFIENTLKNYFDFGFHLHSFYKEYQHSLQATYGKN